MEPEKKETTTRKGSSTQSSSTQSSSTRSKKAPRKETSWIKALKEAGYLSKGDFKPIPRKGTEEYEKVKALQLRME